MAIAGFFVFITTMGLLQSRNVLHSVMFLAVEGLALTAMVWISGPLTLTTLSIGIATLFVKVGVIPGTMYRVISQWPTEYRREHPLPFWAYIVAVALVLAVGHVIHLLTPSGLILHDSLFFYGMASIYLGLLLIISRRHMVSQVSALVAVENGLVVLAASVAGALPTFMEFGMLIDLLVATAILVWMSRRIRWQFNSADVTDLKLLRG
ncbi:hypothetical protein D2Q93_11585 [Alicyclobacillaceae bacterium I2511]|nr:hypothetical protein D2Q93_11585 [Alicyclobacillaceae bacterium I2511]